AIRQSCPADPRPRSAVQVQGNRTDSGRLPRSACRRRSGRCGRGDAGRPRGRQGARHDRADAGRGGKGIGWDTPLAPVLSRFWDDPESWTLETYRRNDGYRALRKALEMEPDAVITAVKDSGLRGRGGAGFSTGTKWSFIPQGARGAAAQ